MKWISLSIVVASLIISFAILYAGGVFRSPDPSQARFLAPDLHRHTEVTRAKVEGVINDPKNQDRIRDYCKEDRGFDIDPTKPLWIRGTLDETSVVVAYETTTSDGKAAALEVVFERDEYGRYQLHSHSNPPLFLNPD